MRRSDTSLAGPWIRHPHRNSASHRVGAPPQSPRPRPSCRVGARTGAVLTGGKRPPQHHVRGTNAQRSYRRASCRQRRAATAAPRGVTTGARAAAKTKSKWRSVRHQLLPPGHYTPPPTHCGIVDTPPAKRTPPSTRWGTRGQRQRRTPRAPRSVVETASAARRRGQKAGLGTPLLHSPPPPTDVIVAVRSRSSGITTTPDGGKRAALRKAHD